MGKTRDLVKKIRDTKGIFYAKMSTKKTKMTWTQHKQQKLRKGVKNTQKNNTKSMLNPPTLPEDGDIVFAPAVDFKIWQ